MLENMHFLKSIINKLSRIERNLKPGAQIHHSQGVYLGKAILQTPKYNLGFNN